MLSRTTSCPLRRYFEIVSHVITIYVISGSRFSVSGVGTQIIKASGFFINVISVVDLNLPLFTIAVISLDGICLSGLWPAFIFLTFFSFISNPITFAPRPTNSLAKGSPTYPIPTMPTSGAFFLLFFAIYRPFEITDFPYTSQSPLLFLPRNSQMAHNRLILSLFSHPQANVLYRPSSAAHKQA